MFTLELSVLKNQFRSEDKSKGKSNFDLLSLFSFTIVGSK